jgi:tetratricopeptide (TPR) repeat protein
MMTVLSLSTFSQTTEKLKIDSLKNLATHLKGSERINCLNLLARNISTAHLNLNERADSIYYYASAANNEANKIGYKKGIAASLMNLADYEQMKALGLRINGKDDAEAQKEVEKYLTQSITLAEQIHDYETLGYTYMFWADMVYVKNKYVENEARNIYRKKSIDNFNKAGNERQEGKLCTWLSESYIATGYYEEAFEYCQRAIALNKKVIPQAITKEEKAYNNVVYQVSLSDMAKLYETAGDYQTALQYLNQNNQFTMEHQTGFDVAEEKAEIFRLTNQYDSSFYYLKKLMVQNPDNAAWIRKDIGATFLLKNEYDSALAILQESLAFYKKNDPVGRALSPILLYMGSAYAGKNEYATALPYAREGMALTLKIGSRSDELKGYELLSGIYHHLGNNDSAYQYLFKYLTLKDSVQNRQFIFRLNNYKKVAEDTIKEARIGLLNKDNKIKDQQLKQEATVKKFLVAVFIAFVFAGMYVFRNLTLKRKNEKLQRDQAEQEWKMKHLESEKKQAELQRQAGELEMQALRAQMNPHFIFNCLSSINRFILKNESKTASNYLTRFSRLMRMVLINSQKQLIALEDELEMLRLYLEMERLRFKNSFDYGITLLNEIDSGNIFIPPLLLQPFCENAIWHGLMHLPSVQSGRQGRLDIELSMQENILHCVITDNGIGREKAAEMKSKTAEKEKSMGLKITTERLALINRKKGIHTFYEIEDLKDEMGNVAGTKVTIKISFNESVEELV